jgi:hypothetical protein
MKYFVAAGTIVLVAINGLLLVKQQRLSERVTTLDRQNTELHQKLTSRPVASAEEVRDAEQRLASAQQTLTDVEQRLASATASLNGSPANGPRTIGSAPVPRSINPAATTLTGDIASSLPATPTGVELVPSSSHSPDGNLQTRSWGPEQVLGPPNTHSAGDIPTAWAPLSSQGGANEWLHVNYDRSVDISEVRVRETYNPGAISKLAAVLPDGREMTLWEGTEPKSEAPVDMSFSVPPGVSAQSVKIYLDRTRVSGWNEIDSVELIGRDGTRQWATSAKSSSSYAEQTRLTATSLPEARQ